jgi:hypothetical protein
MIRATVMGISRSSFFSQKRQHPRQFRCLVEIARQLGAAHESNRSCSKQQGGGSRFNPAFDHRRGGGNLLFVFSHLVHGFGDAFFSFLTGLF